MLRKAIVFDVDGVITYSAEQKDLIIEQILEKHKLLPLPWVREILDAGLNRVLILEKIQKIQDFDIQKVLSEIDSSLLILESTTTAIETSSNFLKKYVHNYDFFTNTSLPKRKLIDIFQRLELTEYFTELLAYEDGSKRENIEYIMQVYGISPENMLFIDDKQAHIDAVKTTGVHTLLFERDWVSLEEKIQDIF